jgi:hypothetical protein
MAESLPRHILNTALSSAARTATVSSSDINTDAPYHGIIVYLDVTVASGTGGLQVIIEGKDPTSGNYVPINATPTLVITTGTKAYVVYSGIGAAAGGVVQTTSNILPLPFRIRIAVGDASS